MLVGSPRPQEALMKVLGIRFCTVTPHARELAGFMSALGIPQRSLEDVLPVTDSTFAGAIFLAGDSWIEMWPEGPEMPLGTMLQIVVDDADAFAGQARENGLAPEGPMDAHGERIYFLTAPGGLQVSFQSALP
jgi:hypothetical protein